MISKTKELKTRYASSVGSSKLTLGNTISLAFLWGITALLFLFPFYWVVTGSLKSRKATLMLPPQWFPLEPTLDNYRTLFKNPAVTWFLNSLVIALVTMVIVCVIASLAGYVLAKKRFIGQKVVFGFFVMAMALPKQVILVPLVRLMAGWGLHDNLWAVILGSIGWPFGIFLMKQFSETIPGELLEAARIDGCGELRTFGTIVLPLVKSGIAALAIFTFITSWNDYFLQLIMLNKRTNLTLQLGIATLQTEFSTNYGLLSAGATFAALPIIIVFVSFQKYFTQGITMGAVKG